jgi:hypothetical protein
MDGQHGLEGVRGDQFLDPPPHPAHHDGDRLGFAHSLVDSVRNVGGFGLPPDGAPCSTFWFRNWRVAVDDSRFYGVKGPLLLRLAIEAG